MTPDLTPAPLQPGPSHPGHDARRLELIQRVADDLAHEIRNPLNAIVINLEVLRRRAADADHTAVQERVAVLGDEVRRLHLLVDNLLRLLRRPRDDVGPAHVGEVLDTVVPLLEAMASAERVRLRRTANADEATTSVRASDLRFALLHLVDIALRRTDGGELVIAADAGDLEVTIGVSFRSGEPAPAFLAAVRDGVDIAAGFLADAGGRVESWAPDSAGEAALRVIVPRNGSA